MRRSSGRRRRRRRGCPPAPPAGGRGGAARHRRPGTRPRTRARSAPASDDGWRDRSRGAPRPARRDRRSRRRRELAAGPRRSAAPRLPRPGGRDPRPSRRTATCRVGPPPAVRTFASAAACRRLAARRSGRRSARMFEPSPASSRTCRARACRVRISIDVASGTCGPRRFATRAPRSSAASRLKVTTQILEGSTPRERSTASRATIVVVLPLPAGAMIWAGPSGRVAAARCSGSSAARIGPTSIDGAVATAVCIGPWCERPAYQRVTGGLSVTPRRCRPSRWAKPYPVAAQRDRTQTQHETQLSRDHVRNNDLPYDRELIRSGGASQRGDRRNRARSSRPAPNRTTGPGPARSCGPSATCCCWRWWR